MRALQFINHFSIDVAIGAVISSMFFAKVFGVLIDWQVLVLLGLVVWLIYTFDHLQDAKSLKTRAKTKRHRLHQDYYQILSVMMVIGLLVAAVLVFFIPLNTLAWGASLFCLVAAYFICIHFLKVRVRHYKEVIIAILYTAGIVLPVLSIYEGVVTTENLLIMLEFVLLAFTNLLIFSLIERDVDSKQEFPSIVLNMGVKKVGKLLNALIFVHLIILIIIFFLKPSVEIPLIFVAMAVLLYITILFIRKTRENILYRIIGDGVFLLPLVLL